MSYLNSAEMTAEKKIRVRKMIARTLRQKKDDVVALMKEYDKEFDPKNHGAIVSALVKLLKGNEQFRQKFADIAVTKVPILKADKAKIASKDKPAKLKADKQNTFSHADGATLANDIKEVIEVTSETEFENVAIQEKRCSLGKWAVYGAVAVVLVLILRKY
jgi:hypothetical protein